MQELCYSCFSKCTVSPNLNAKRRIHWDHWNVIELHIIQWDVMHDLFQAIQGSICNASSPGLSVQKVWYTMQTVWSTALCLSHKCGYEYSEDKHDKKTDLIHIAIYLVWVITSLSFSHIFHACYFKCMCNSTISQGYWNSVWENDINISRYNNSSNVDPTIFCS